MQPNKLIAKNKAKKHLVHSIKKKKTPHDSYWEACLNSIDPTEAEDIKKRWQEYIEELYKKALSDPDNHDGVITHQEPDIQESKVKWALESITTSKARGGDGIPTELFQILKDDAVKVLHSICQQI